MTTMKIEVYEPPMCCSSGVCGASVDPQLVRFSADLDWLKSQGCSVERINLAQQPGAFAQDEAVKAALGTKGEASLPLVKVNGEVKSSGVYPSRAELAAWAGIDGSTASIFTDAVAELIAIGAAIASTCEPCFKFHYDKARKLGVSKADMRLAVDMAQAVKDSPARSVLALADKYLNSPQPQASACCDPASNLDEVLGVRLGSVPAAVPGVPRLEAMNPDPEVATGEYRERRVGPFCGALPGATLRSREEQLSGSCTVRSSS